MQGIICSIRGGPASQSTIRYAIDLARRDQLQLTFLYVVNFDFLSRTIKIRSASMQDDLRQMGELILLLAQETAAAAGVEAGIVVREGHVAAQIVALCAELNADYVVVGEPLRSQETAVFSSENVKTLGEQLQKRCQADLIVVA